MGATILLFFNGAGPLNVVNGPLFFPAAGIYRPGGKVAGIYRPGAKAAEAR